LVVTKSYPKFLTYAGPHRGRRTLEPGERLLRSLSAVSDARGHRGLSGLPTRPRQEHQIKI